MMISNLEILLILVIKANLLLITYEYDEKLSFDRVFLTNKLEKYKWSEEFNTRINLFDEGNGGGIIIRTLTNGMTIVGIKILIDNITQVSQNLTINQSIPFYIPYGSNDKSFSIEMYCSCTRVGGSCGIAAVQILSSPVLQTIATENNICSIEVCSNKSYNFSQPSKVIKEIDGIQLRGILGIIEINNNFILIDNQNNRSNHSESFKYLEHKNKL